MGETRQRVCRRTYQTHLVLGAAGLHLVGEDLGTGLLRLRLVDVLHQDALILEHIALRLLVEGVVAGNSNNQHTDPTGPLIGGIRTKRKHSQVLVDLACLTVLAEETAEDTLATHPEHLGGHTRIGGTLALTGAHVTTLALRGEQGDRARTRVHRRGLDDNAPIFDELLDVRARVGVADLSLLGRVEPDLALADARDGRGEPLLLTEVHHLDGVCLYCFLKKTYVSYRAPTLTRATAGGAPEGGLKVEADDEDEAERERVT
jgi:hypothetical protein